MSGVEVLAGLGYLATELFKYNRENYEFDQDQRFAREEVRLKMQVERFSLFREDVRDLVELTVGKMDLYHLIGALFLKMIVLYFCVGFFVKPVPPFILILYYVSNAASWVWLMVAIWLSMHASISSHSYGVRLLCRFVRLPIPGSAQLNVLNARFTDFEKQGLQMLRVPFVTKQANMWRQRNAGGNLGEDAPRPVGEDGKPRAARSLGGRGAFAAGAGSGAASSSGAGGGGEDWLGAGEYAYGGGEDIAGREAELLRAVEFRTHRHVQLFRELQSQWQCYDAYARVAMSLGVRAMLQSLTYYLMGLCLVDQQAPFVAYTLTVALQAMAMCLYVLDIHGLPFVGSFGLPLLGCAPCVIALVELSMSGRSEDGLLLEDNQYLVAIACFPVEVFWLHLTLWAAGPSDRVNALPRHFRSVLFMDVFAEVDDPAAAGPARGGADAERSEIEKRAEAADFALFEANAALRRWEAVPAHDTLSSEQVQRVRQASRELARWVRALSHELALRKVPGLAADQVNRRPWEQLSTLEREQDPFTGYLLGPFVSSDGGSRYFYDPEAREFLDDPIPGGRRTFTVEQLLGVVGEFAREVESVCAVGGRPEKSTVTRAGSGDSCSDGADGGADSDASDSPLRRARSQSTLASKAKSEAKANQLKPNRLPWILVRIAGRAIQFVWIFCFIMMLLRALSEFICPEHHSRSFRGNVSVEQCRARWIHDWQAEPSWGRLSRRLGASGAASLQPLTAERDVPATPTPASDGGGGWPCDCPFFRPARLSCVPAGVALGGAPAAAGPRLVVADAFATYRAARGVGGDGGVEELPREVFPPDAVAVCGSRSEGAAPRCLLGMVTEDGLTFWPANRRMGAVADASGSSFTLAFQAEAWKLFAGALVPCAAAVAPTLPANADENAPAYTGNVTEAPMCLLLAGSPGAGRLQVALAPMPAGAASGGSASGQLLTTYIEMYPDASYAAGDLVVSSGAFGSPTLITALSLEPHRGRLAALGADGTLAAWTLLGGAPRRLGRWQLRAALAGAEAFQASGLCEDQATDELLIVGRAPSAASPMLLRSTLPVA